MSGVTVRDMTELATAAGRWLTGHLHERQQFRAGGELYVQARGEDVPGLDGSDIVFMRLRDGALLKMDVDIRVSAGAS